MALKSCSVSSVLGPWPASSSFGLQYRILPCAEMGDVEDRAVRPPESEKEVSNPRVIAQERHTAVKGLLCTLASSGGADTVARKPRAPTSPFSFSSSTQSLRTVSALCRPFVDLDRERHRSDGSLFSRNLVADPVHYQRSAQGFYRAALQPPRCSRGPAARLGSSTCGRHPRPAEPRHGPEPLFEKPFPGKWDRFPVRSARLPACGTQGRLLFLLPVGD